MLGKSKKQILPLILGLGFYAVAILINSNLKKPEIIIDKQDSALNFNTTFIKTISAGNKRLLADVLWVQTLLESDESHYKKSDLNSWMYLRFKNIAELDPMFYQNYLWGGVYLSIIKDDILGAAEIFERGLKYYPDDYYINYNAAFNYYAQIKDYERAYQLLSKIQYHSKAPGFLPSLTARIKFQTSFDFDGTIAFLLDHYNNSKDEFLKSRIKINLYALKAERDLVCLNSKKDNCEIKDLDGNEYLYVEGKFKAQKEFVPYRLRKTGGD